MRRLPVYLVIDTSESMVGEPIASVNTGLEAMLRTLRKDPYALETVSLCLITFDSVARVRSPMTEIIDFQIPPLNIRPGTALGMAIHLLTQQIQNDAKSSPSGSRNFRPIVFLITDGQPTDRYQEAVRRLNEIHPRPANIYAIGCGNEVDFHMLREISDITFHMKEMDTEHFAKFFVWMSASVQSVSQGCDDKIPLEKTPLPEGFSVIDDENCPDYPKEPLQVFLHVLCGTTGKPYMLRYVFREEYNSYEVRDVHPLPDDFAAEEGDAPPPIASDKLFGMLPCPYCHHKTICTCSCNTHFCISDELESGDMTTCPSCHTTLPLGVSDEPFDIRRSSG